ncbi:MAG: response regulator transcription factor [Armatimonadota bacterium]
MSRILIADDDKDLVEGLRWYLEAEGFEVLAAEDGKQALDIFRKEHPDLVVLDIMMPAMNGNEVCTAIHAESDAYIMMLSARDGELDKVRALQLGADDYMTKPFHASELIARVNAILRRSRVVQVASPSYKYKGLEIYFDERKIKVHGEFVELTTMEFDLISYFVNHPQKVLTRDQLSDTIWGDDFYGDMRLVDNHVYRLREKLSKAGLEINPIVTIRGVGYAYRPEN